jgi:hypothetical protein
VLAGGGLLLDCTARSVPEAFIKSLKALAEFCLVGGCDDALFAVSAAASVIGFDTASFAFDVDTADLLATALVLPRPCSDIPVMEVDWR